MNQWDLGHNGREVTISDEAIYLTGEAKAPTNNPITNTWGLFFVGLVVDPATHTIQDAECSATLALTRDFVRSLLVERSILDTDALLRMIDSRYHGSSQRALSASVRNAASKYREIRAIEQGR